MSRGYGFVEFVDPSVVSTVLEDEHMIDGEPVKIKRPFPKDDKFNAGRKSGGSGSDRTNKVLVGGLTSTLRTGEFCHYFASYGNVTDVVVLKEQQTNQPRGFGVVTYDSKDAVDFVFQKEYHELDGRKLIVERVFPSVEGVHGWATPAYPTSSDLYNPPDSKVMRPNQL